MSEKKKNRQKSQEYQIDAKGSLGLLAAGYQGLRAWRKVRDEVKHSVKMKK